MFTQNDTAVAEDSYNTYPAQPPLGGCTSETSAPAGRGWLGLLKPLGFGLVFLALLWVAGGIAQAQGPDQEPPYDEKEAQSIDKTLMCPVCVGVTIEQSQAQIARDMQGIVREMLAQGKSRDEILDFFVDRYGVGVLAAPPKSGANLLVWILPAVGVLAALAAVFAIIRSMASNGSSEIATEPALEDGLDPYLEAIDRELALSEEDDIGIGQDHGGPEPPSSRVTGVEPPKEGGSQRNG